MTKDVESPPIDMFYLAGESPKIGDMLAWAYAAHGKHLVAEHMKTMAQHGRDRLRTTASILPFNQPEKPSC